MKEVNHSLACIIQFLQEYLNELELTNAAAEYRSILSEPIKRADVYNVDPIEKDLEEIYIVNFNYTDTIKRYLHDLSHNGEAYSPKVNFIHGQLNNDDNPLVFGFGDEFDFAYKKIEDDSKVHGYFDYIKSFWYLRTDNYRELVSFVDSKKYQVCVLGHSCGLSDRTMLQMIFEHNNCRSVKIYYHQDGLTNNFVSLTHEIARHFSDKRMMRKKIVSLRSSSPMPQVLT